MDKANTVGIMTWYKYINYGSALQAFALAQCVKKLGYEARFVNYTPRSRACYEEIVNASYWREKLKQKIEWNNYNSEAKKALFSDFQKKYLKETHSCNTLPELCQLNQEMDSFLCGSDQIWAPNCFDDKYFLSFVTDNRKMVAYAPSIGLPSIDNPWVAQQMRKLISRFKHLSIREKAGQSLIWEMCGKQAQLVLDPTLLLSAEEWTQTLSLDKSPVKHLQGSYILCYFLGDTKNYIKCVNQLARKKQMPVNLIPIYQSQRRFASSFVPFDVGPCEFVDLIRRASYVCTDSYHGMAFAINYNIPFSVFKRFKDHDKINQNSRISSLADIMGLETRLVDPRSKNSQEGLSDCDFSSVDEKLLLGRKDSYSYLESSLKTATQPSAVPTQSRTFKITELCCGCGSCAGICPQKAITIQKNAEGFEYYHINDSLCIQCGKCKSVCPFVCVTAPSLQRAEKLYSAKSTHEKILQASSSGGLAYEIARKYNEAGYWVCGSTYDRQHDCARHILIKPGHTDELMKLQGSKYLQSISAKSIAEVLDLPRDDKLVFFGTPCQVAGLDHALCSRGKRGKAILVDLICHGVPSELLWKKYLSEKEKNARLGAHPDVIFRDKTNGWRRLKLLLRSANDKTSFYSKTEEKDDFYAFFRSGVCYDRTCYECPYREKSAADIRLGDYWGSRFADDKTGVSMVIAITDCGEKVVETLKAAECAQIAPHDLSEYWSAQFPTNTSIPSFYNELLGKLSDSHMGLKKLRAEYCKSFETIDKVSKIAQGLHAVIIKDYEK